MTGDVPSVGLLALSMLTAEQHRALLADHAAIARQAAEQQCRDSGHEIRYESGEVPRCTSCDRPASELYPPPEPEQRTFTLARAAELLGADPGALDRARAALHEERDAWFARYGDGEARH